MKVRQVFEAVMVELSKIQAPTLKLFEFNYLINKAIQQFVNKEYNIYDTSQQTTDNLSVLKKSEEFTFNSNEIVLNDDYLHLLNCICVFKVKNNNYKCWKAGSIIETPATKINSDSWGQIIIDYYNKPSFKKPYFNIYSTFTETNNKVTIENSESIVLNDTLNLTNLLEEQTLPEEKQGEIKTYCKIECGNLPNNIELEKIKIDYLRKPTIIKLTQEQVDTIVDNSQTMEFPDYVNQEIINELVHLVMERSQDPRLTTHYQMTQSIAKPTGQQANNQN